MSEPRLFIGGPKDGERIATESPAVEVPERQDDGTYGIVRYYPMPFAGDDHDGQYRRFTVYAVDGLSAADAMERLIQGYRGTG